MFCCGLLTAACGTELPVPNVRSIQDNSGLPKDLPASLWQAESAENPAGVPMPDIRRREFITLLGGPPGTASPPVEPQAEQRPLERTLHDLRLIDEYAWLKAENWREVMRDPFQLDPAIRAYLQAENDYCERALADTKSLQG